ncbi:mandelate racemase/muconate lactonizing enzyme family protein [Shinella sp.]|uniref:mandelate racemase/muconate lactonizing enzyme family protein n=1 Tax=Shinella sp. TaxID=1870904 RepID=UPI003F71B2B7
MSVIEAIEACTVNLTLTKPVQLSTRRIEKRCYTLVRIRCTDGSTGIGICHGGTRYGGLATTAVRELFRPLLIGEDAHRTEGLWQAMYQDSLLNGRTGAVMRALSAVDIALWDRNARKSGLPLWRYLGAVSKGTIPTYASGGYYADGKSAHDLGDEVAGYVAAGFKAVKIKIGAAAPSVDLARVAAARAALGDDGLLLLDANNAWNNLASALKTLRPMLDYRPFLIEEPFGPDDNDNHARLAAALPVSIATGELVAGRWGHRELMERARITVLQPDVAVCGGVTEFRKIAATAASSGVAIAPHSLQDIHAHLVASTQNALFLEYFPDDAIVPVGKLFDRRLQLRGGNVDLPQQPGLGFDFDEDAVSHYQVDPWS